jgi:hypothetical protein
LIVYFHNHLFLYRVLTISSDALGPPGVTIIMNRKNILLFVVMAALAAIYVFYFTDLFRHKSLHIYDLTRALGPQNEASDNLMFGLGGKYQLTEIKVVAKADYESNPKAVPLWHLVAKTHSAHIGYFKYGDRIDGMAPLVAGDQAQPLTAGVTYRIFVSTPKISGFHDFTLAGTAPVTDANASR